MVAKSCTLTFKIWVQIRILEENPKRISNRYSIFFHLCSSEILPGSYFHPFPSGFSSVIVSILSPIYYKSFLSYWLFVMSIKTCWKLYQLKKIPKPSLYSTLPGTSLSFIWTIKLSSWYLLPALADSSSHLPPASQHWQSGFSWNFQGYQDLYIAIPSNLIPSSTPFPSSASVTLPLFVEFSPTFSADFQSLVLSLCLLPTA